MANKTSTRQEQDRYDCIYEILYTDLRKASDADLVEWERYFSRQSKENGDFFYIGLSVCTDILFMRAIDEQNFFCLNGE